MEPSAIQTASFNVAVVAPHLAKVDAKEDVKEVAKEVAMGLVRELADWDALALVPLELYSLHILLNK